MIIPRRRSRKPPPCKPASSTYHAYAGKADTFYVYRDSLRIPSIVLEEAFLRH